MSHCLPFSNQPGEFEVKRIICVGRNYAEHAREMGHNPDTSTPFFFFKPGTALLPPGVDFVYPHFSREVHHELELVVAIDHAGFNIDAETAKSLITGFGVGLDMTCRDIQREAKKAGRPWELAKGFDGSAPCSALVAGSYAALQNTRHLQLLKNNAEVQATDWREMIWPVPALIAEFSRYFALAPGDLFFTGTPAGVGAVAPSDKLSARLDNICRLDLTILPAK